SLTDVAPERSTRLSGRRLALLVAASLLAPAVLLAQRASGTSIDAIAVALGGATLSLLVLLRMAGLGRQAGALRTQERDADQRTRDGGHDIDGVVWEASGDMRRFSFVAGRAEELLGYRPEAWLEEEDLWERVVHDEDRVRMAALRRRALTNGKDYAAEF